MGEITRSDMHIDTIGSDIFLKEIMEAIAALVFPHFGFRGWKEHYSENSPVWKLAYNIPLWVKSLEAEIGWGLQKLFLTKPDATIPFFDPDYIKDVVSRLVKRGIEKDNWQPVLDTCREMPCDEDFEKWNTNVRTDFLRKWYHTRSKNVQMISLDACLEDEEHGIFEIEDKSTNFEDEVVAEDFYQRFKARLSQKDMEILELRVEGFTYEEIADKLGYKNHSGVIKRIRAIEKEFIRYEQQR